MFSNNCYGVAPQKNVSEILQNLILFVFRVSAAHCRLRNKIARAITRVEYSITRDYLDRYVNVAVADTSWKAFSLSVFSFSFFFPFKRRGIMLQRPRSAKTRARPRFVSDTVGLDDATSTTSSSRSSVALRIIKAVGREVVERNALVHHPRALQRTHDPFLSADGARLILIFVEL